MGPVGPPVGHPRFVVASLSRCLSASGATSDDDSTAAQFARTDKLRYSDRIGRIRVGPSSALSREALRAIVSAGVGRRARVEEACERNRGKRLLFNCRRRSVALPISSGARRGPTVKPCVRSKGLRPNRDQRCHKPLGVRRARLRPTTTIADLQVRLARCTHGRFRDARVLGWEQICRRVDALRRCVDARSGQCRRRVRRASACCRGKPLASTRREPCVLSENLHASISTWPGCRAPPV